ncbi:hypothetical protein [Sulfurospirillum oryzae]|uniref:hypothetical protein n=1 Tax=Sulfurospirillum oryzae TaxID=2976535 RepID=UPI0021E716DC|nr:hypothetical protein [Sulfurospirillum oryzae]
MKIVKTLLISTVLVFSGITSAHAMGDREKGALLGAGAVVLLGSLINASQQPTRYVESPVYYEPRPTVVYREPVYVQERVIYVDPPRHHHHHYDDGYYRSYR